MMRMILALGLVAGTALPAHAADLATIGCVEDTINAKARAQLETDVQRNLTDLGKRPSYDPSVQSGLTIAAAACAKVNGWSSGAATAAAKYALAKIGLPFAQAALAEKGFDSAALEAQFMALSEDVRQRPLTAAETQDLVKNAVIDEAQQTRENAELLGQFFAFLNTVQYASFQFSEG
jgi:hypothetical protein